MDKLWLIIKREYLTRVKKRSFILGTILTPLAFALFFVVVGFIFSYDSGEKLKIAILDKGNFLEGRALKAEEDGSLYFDKTKKDLESIKGDIKEGTYDGALVIPELKNVNTKSHTIFYYAEDQLSIEVADKIEDKVQAVVRDYKIEQLNLDKKELEALQTKIKLDPEPLDDSEEDATTMTSAIGAGIGMIMGFFMYMAVFIYGMMVMHSVKEEKTSRIVEVMISSVKPFQLMLGKIIGVGAVGLTQVAIWAILIPLVYFGVFLIFGFDPEQMQNAQMNAPEIDPDDVQAMVTQGVAELGKMNWWMMFPMFIFYFLGGYFLYSSLFAAVGSAMGDDLSEGQALTIPITIPVIIALYIMIVAVRTPHSNLAIWSSIFPLFSPIVMPARLAFDPPFWQVGLSILVLAATCIFFVWLSARIYRVGILMYGKKVTFKEIGKWIFYKD